jgi:spore photoproduct lyase
LPANIDDFFAQFNALYEKIKKPIRIGTGEFCDSLALDHITEYSKKLIPFFKNKNGYFELKTKSANINNILEIDASPNIVISWSLNPNELIKSEELATAALGERLEAAKKVKQKGYNIAFHFDPIIYSENYKSLYQEVVEKIYSHLPGPFAWISLGTLRSHRQLKSIAEQRFSKSNIFYGELLLSEDKKLRYPKFLRQEIYKNMLKLIRSHDNTTPLYLCMEDKETWAILGKGTPAEIEAGLLR